MLMKQDPGTSPGGPASLPPVPSLEGEAIGIGLGRWVSDQGVEDRGAECLCPQGDLEMTHMPLEGREKLRDEWIANQREGPSFRALIRPRQLLQQHLQCVGLSDPTGGAGVGRASRLADVCFPPAGPAWSSS